MTKHHAENVPVKAEPQKPASWYYTVIELASKGVSNRAIAARLGISSEDFTTLVEYQENGRKPVKEAIELARAQFEIERVEQKDAILNDPATSKGLRYKIIREDLKTLEEWAPASRSVKVTVESGPTGFSFEAFSPNEIEKIVEASNEADRTDNAEG